nr:cupin domain-containing protein [Saccharopolyspora hirsuta]
MARGRRRDCPRARDGPEHLLGGDRRARPGSRGGVRGVRGGFNDGVRDYPAGSFIHAPAGTSHIPRTATGCALFLFYPEG